MRGSPPLNPGLIFEWCAASLDITDTVQLLLIVPQKIIIPFGSFRAPYCLMSAFILTLGNKSLPRWASPHCRYDIWQEIEVRTNINRLCRSVLLSLFIRAGSAGWDRISGIAVVCHVWQCRMYDKYAECDSLFAVSYLQHEMSLLLDGRDSPIGCTCYIKLCEAHLINVMVVFLLRFHLPKDKTDWKRETGLYFPHWYVCVFV